MPRATKTTKTTKTAADTTTADVMVDVTPITTEQPVAEQPVAEQPVIEQPQAEITEQTELAIPAATTLALPALDAPAVNADQPVLSYKTIFGNPNEFAQSEDGGKTNTPSGTNVIAGAPVDLVLQLSPASWEPGRFDERLRLMFMEQSGRLVELNLNAVNRSQAGALYVTSPVRSLVGGLLAVSYSEDDIHAFLNGIRLTLVPGVRRGLFIELDVNAGGGWVTMSSPSLTQQVSTDPAEFHAQLTLIKQRIRGAGGLLTSSAITGDLEGYDAGQRLLASADPNQAG